MEGAQIILKNREIQDIDEEINKKVDVRDKD
jgi:predicted polyphosphate/ATP-dependent NAD kinase